MAEEEKIVHHAKEAVHALANKEKKWKEKVKDFLLEILIIIIAVSITLWFHNWNDKRIERDTEKHFLISLRSNLKDNKIAMDTMVNYFSNVMLKSYDTVLSQIKNNKVDDKLVDANTRNLLFFRSRNLDFGIFESFKSSGNLRLIENQKLLTDIVSLYSSAMPFREAQIRASSEELSDTYDKYVGLKYGALDTAISVKISPYLKDPNVLFFLQKNQTQFYWLISNMKGTISAMDSTLKELDTELKDRFDYTVSDKK